MNFGMVLKVIGNLIIYESFALIAALGIAFYYDGSDIYPFIQTIIIMLAIGYQLAKLKQK